MKFRLGEVLATPGALAALRDCGDDPAVYLGRHLRGDWGVVSDSDKRLNDQALKEGTRLLSAYLLGNGVKIWILTESDRSATTILLPEEY